MTVITSQVPAHRFALLVEPCTDAEADHVLGVIRAALMAMDAAVAAEVDRLVAEFRERAASLAGGR